MMTRIRELHVIPEEFFPAFDRQCEQYVPILNNFIVDYDDSSGALECLEKNMIELIKQTSEESLAGNKPGH
eukprot:6507910-Ditylum_brightwellii.AAC.1